MPEDKRLQFRDYCVAVSRNTGSLFVFIYEKNILDVAKRNEKKNLKSHRREVKVIGVLFTAESEEKSQRLNIYWTSSYGA